MYKNDGKAVADKYGYNERQALYNWWQAFKGDRERPQQPEEIQGGQGGRQHQQEGASKRATTIYRIEPQSIMDRLGVVIFSLVFYVVYTLWYGFAILFMFEGWGMKTRALMFFSSCRKKKMLTTFGRLRRTPLQPSAGGGKPLIRADASALLSYSG